MKKERENIMMNIDFTKVEVLTVGGIDMQDYPDFCDAYIEEAEINGVYATDEELDAINEDGDFVYEAVMNYLY